LVFCSFYQFTELNCIRQPSNGDCDRLRRLKDVVKSTEHLEESIKSLCQWLLDAKERLISPVVYQHADEDEIRRHVSEQEASDDVSCYRHC